jgi:hypothetical protein
MKLLIILILIMITLSYASIEIRDNTFSLDTNCYWLLSRDGEVFMQGENGYFNFDIEEGYYAFEMNY